MRSKIFTQYAFKKDIYSKAWYIMRNNNLKGDEKLKRLEELHKIVLEMVSFGYINIYIREELTQFIVILKTNVYHDFDKDKGMYENE